MFIMRKGLLFLMVIICSVVVFAEICGTGSTQGLISYYKLDESSGDVVDFYDGNNGTVFGGLIRNLTGQVNKSFSFDGSNDYVNLDSLVDDVNLYSEGTISGWVKVVDLSFYNVITFSDTNADEFFRISSENGHFYAHVKGISGNKWLLKTDDVVFNSDNWTYFSVVHKM